jgi:hypothetical protein
MDNITPLLKKLDPFANNANSVIAEAAAKIAANAKDVESGSLSIDEFKELASDLDALKESVTEADDVANVEMVNTIFNGLVTVLSKA